MSPIALVGWFANDLVSNLRAERQLIGEAEAHPGTDQAELLLLVIVHAEAVGLVLAVENVGLVAIQPAIAHHLAITRFELQGEVTVTGDVTRNEAAADPVAANARAFA